MGHWEPIGRFPQDPDPEPLLDPQDLLSRTADTGSVRGGEESSIRLYPTYKIQKSI